MQIWDKNIQLLWLEQERNKSLYGLSRNYCTSLASEEHINVSESIISLPFSHTGLQHWSTEVSFIRQRSSKGWPALTVTLETSSFLLTSVSRSETQIRASSYTTNLTVRYFLSYLFTTIELLSVVWLIRDSPSASFWLLWPICLPFLATVLIFFW